MPSLALSMITRDAALDLGNCLRSVKEIVDEMVIADTGSNDATVAVAREFGATVVQIAWNNDFAEARNQSLREVRADWVLVLDADEQLNPSEAHNIRSCIAADGIAGYLVSIRNYLNSLTERVWDKAAVPNSHPPEFARQYPAFVDHQNVRLFRRLPGVLFTGRVHETVGHSIEAAGGSLRPASFLIHHFGLAASQDHKAQKNRFYRELGRAKIADDANDAQAHFELGVLELDAFHDYEEALRLFDSAIALKPGFGEAWLFSGVALSRLSRWSEATDRFRQARALRHVPALGAELEGDARFEMKDFAAAANCYRDALRIQKDSCVLEGKLAFAELHLGQAQNAIMRLRKCVRREPANPEVHDRLIAALVSANELDQAAIAAEARLSGTNPDDRCYLRAASIYARLNRWDKAHALLSRGLEAFPGALRLRQAHQEAAARLSTSGQREQGMNFQLKAFGAGPIT